MKKALKLIFAAALVILSAGCQQKEIDDGTIKISIQLKSSGAAMNKADVVVSLTNEEGSVFDAKTNKSGQATFKVPAGTYSAAAVIRASGDFTDGARTAYKGFIDEIVVDETPGKAPFEMEMASVKASQIIIKEVYSTGCPKNESGTYSDDAYIILYNNSSVEVDATDIAFAITLPSNSNGTNSYRTETGYAIVETDWIPAQAAICRPARFMFFLPFCHPSMIRMVASSGP